MPKEKMWVEYEDGSHLSRSAKKPGAFSPLTRDDGTNKLGHVTLDPIDGDERPSGRSELQDFAREVAVRVAVEVTLRALETAKPHVEKWVAETAAPAVGSAVASAGSAVGSAAVSAGSAVGSAAVSAGSAVGSTVSSAWNRVTRKKRKPAPVGAEVVVEVADAPHDLAATVEAYRAGMSREEARQRVIAALAARLFSEQQLAIVRNARIEDDGNAPELDGTTLALTQQQIGEGIQLMLEADPALLSGDTLANLRRILAPRIES